jgi:hypothetical protein
MDYFSEQWKNYQHILMAEAIKRVRELHKEYEGEDCSFCEHCEDSHAGSGMMLYPCPTIKALDNN